MEHNQNTTAAINHQRAIRIKFHGHFLLFHQCRNKTSRCREVWQLGLALVAVAVVERWLLEEVRLYSQKIDKRTTASMRFSQY